MGPVGLVAALGQIGDVGRRIAVAGAGGAKGGDTQGLRRQARAWRICKAPTVADRVVQQAIAQVLTPIFDPTFSELSFGFVHFAHPASRDQPSAVLRPCGAGRPGRNAHQAIRQVQAYVNDGWRIAVDIDLAKFFDTVNHDLLMNLLGAASKRQSLSSSEPTC